MLLAYTDGTTRSSNPGPIAWAVIYVNDGQIVREECGALYTGTNNRAEVLAVIWALERESRVDLTVRTDSTLVLNIATGLWIAKSNLDLWERFFIALEKRNFRALITKFEYVKGHSTDGYNRRADTMARKAAIKAAECLLETQLEAS